MAANGKAADGGLVLDGFQKVKSDYQRKLKIVYMSDKGVKADGTTDDTDAIQTAFNTASESNPTRFVFDTGVVRTTATINFPFAPYSEIVGAGVGSKGRTTVFKPDGDFNWLRFGHEDTHSITVSDLGIVYPDMTGSSNSGRVAVMWGVDGGGQGGLYQHQYRNLYVAGAYDGFALKRGDGAQTMWGSTFDNIHLRGIGHTCFAFMPQTEIGIPVNQFTNIKIFNTQTGVVNTGPAWDLTATEVDIRGVDIEGWHNNIATTVGGGFFRLQGIHAEWHVLSNDFAEMFLLQNGVASISDFSFSLSRASTNTDTAYIIKPNQVYAELKHGIIGDGANTGNAYVNEVVYSGDNQRIRVEDVIVNSPTMTLPGRGDRADETASLLAPAAAARTVSKTSSYTLDTDDTFVLMDGSSLTATLPADPQMGQEYVIKNINSTACTVSGGTGVTIDGASSKSLAQWDVARLLWAGDDAWVTV